MSGKIAVVGGGVAGATAAIVLGRLGLDVTLFDTNDSLVSGPPFCHLHAGGNLYREISDAQCVTLLRESIDLLRFYPYAVDFRPTVIAVPQSDPGDPEALFPRLRLLQDEYAGLIDTDPANEVLGSPQEYYEVYDRERIESLRALEPLQQPRTMDEWMIPVAREIDLDLIKFPLVMVQEYGLNIFRLGAGAALTLESLPHCTLSLCATVTGAVTEAHGVTLQFEQDGRTRSEHFDYLINAAGFRTGAIDDMLGLARDRLVEFKAAYVTQWEDGVAWPEVIFHGERGTPMGMAQFTPYPCGLVQLHGMTNDITLFEGGLVSSSERSAQPPLGKRFVQMIDRQWEWSCVEDRTRRAIAHAARYIPAFKNARVASKPLYGAQQIPGSDPALRAADVSFAGERYARCEVVKASSVLSMTDAIVEKLICLGYLDPAASGRRDYDHLLLPEEGLNQQAAALCETRQYPRCLSGRVVPGVSA